jgi:hypothetical protein
LASCLRLKRPAELPQLILSKHNNHNQTRAMKKTLILVLIAFSLGVLTPQTPATPADSGNDTTIVAAKNKRQPKHPKKKRQPKRVRIFSSATQPQSVSGLPESAPVMIRQFGVGRESSFFQLA